MNNKEKHPLFGELIRTWREYAGLTQEALADLMNDTAAELREADPYTLYEGVTRETVWRWENHKRTPTKTMIKVLAYTLADASFRAGHEADRNDFYGRLIFSLEDPIPAETVSWQAAHLDAIMRLFPKEERIAKWQGIHAWVDNEHAARKDLQKTRGK